MPPKNNPLTHGKKQKALALLQRQQPAAAIPLLEQVCRTDRRDAEAWFMLASARQSLGQLGESASCYLQVLALQPDNAEAHYHLGNVLNEVGKNEEAAEQYKLAIASRPGYIEAHCNLGALYEQQNEYPRALACYREALRLAPERAELHYNVGCALKQLGQLEEAELRYRRAIELRPDFAEAHNNLANVLSENRTRWDEAINHHRRAFELNPDYIEAVYNLGIVLRSCGRLHEAIESYQKAIAGYERLGATRDPHYADAHVNISFAFLLTGNFREGWREYAWKWRCENAPPRPFTPTTWDGSDLGGRPVFLHAEQGLGDEIFFLRFAPELKRRGAGRIAYQSSKKIASLLARCTLIDRLATTAEPPAAGDAVFSVGDLPRLLGMERMNQIPSPVPLVPLAQQTEIIQKRLRASGPPPYIGVTWRAGIAGKERLLHKESPLVLTAQALKQTQGTILILQRHPEAGEIETFTQTLERPVHDFSELNDDLEQMLALLALIDEYVGVSNTNMHLRAGVGKTARVLVPSPPEWRWMAEGKESPWFPGFGVYRQEYDGSWEDAFAMLAADLKQTYGV
ncbi:MAG TPA: tetratricopeptide repeat protein [Burkholderiales bacterium]|nr:tetratricopeptide repeat protein [Burkholderiales bacterium]